MKKKSIFLPFWLTVVNDVIEGVLLIFKKVCRMCAVLEPLSSKFAFLSLWSWCKFYLIKEKADEIYMYSRKNVIEKMLKICLSLINKKRFFVHSRKTPNNNDK